MIFDESVARDSMVKLFADHWAGVNWAAAGLASAPGVIYQGLGGDESPSIDAPHIKWAAYHSYDAQGSLSDDVGNRRFNLAGVLVLQCLAPLAPGNGFTVAERLAIIAKAAYRGRQTPDCINFEKVRIEEVGPDAGWYIFNMHAEFYYCEVA